jgi:Holliday junction resolvasome RuvABC ATP-dependent DNA helicase subunit
MDRKGNMPTSEQVNNEVNDCRPQVIEHFIGQQQVVQMSRIALE